MGRCKKRKCVFDFLSVLAFLERGFSLWVMD
jgi:hypothetical protein